MLRVPRCRVCSGQTRQSAIICIYRSQAKYHRGYDRLVPALASRHDAERAAKPQRCPGYRGVYHGDEKVAAKITATLLRARRYCREDGKMDPKIVILLVMMATLLLLVNYFPSPL